MTTSLGNAEIVRRVEGVGDILAHNVRAQKASNDDVVDGIERLRRIAIRLIELMHKDPDRFSRYAMAPEYDALPRDGKYAEVVRVSSKPKYATGLAAPIHQLIRISEAASEVSNHEMVSYCLGNLLVVLDAMSRRPDVEYFVSDLLGQIRSAVWDANVSAKRPIVGPVTWYVDIVFRDSPGEGHFQLSYLPMFDAACFDTAVRLVQGKDSSLFAAMADSFARAFDWTIGHGDIWDYEALLFDNRRPWEELRAANDRLGIERDVRRLAALEDRVSSLVEFETWTLEFSRLKDAIRSLLAPVQLARAELLESKILAVLESTFKFANLRQLVFSIGAYCLYRKEPELIKVLWEAGVTVGADRSRLVPVDVGTLFDVYFSQGLWTKQRSLYWEHAHDSEVHFERYMALTFVRAVDAAMNPPGSIRAYEIRANTGVELDSIVYRAERLEQAMTWVRQQENLLDKLALTIGDTLSTETIRLLRGLAEQARRRMGEVEVEQPISDQRLAEFKADVMTAFRDDAVARKLFSSADKLVVQPTAETEIRTFSETWPDEKAALLDHWPVHYPVWGSRYGRWLANKENNFIFSEIARRSVPLTAPVEDLVRVGRWAVMAAQIRPDEFAQFGWTYKKRERTETIAIGPSEMPLYLLHDAGLSRCALFVNIETIGRLVQIRQDTDDDVAINVRVLSREPDAISGLLLAPPPWLLTYEPQARQHRLLTTMLVTVAERVALQLDNLQAFMKEIAPRERT